MLWKYAAPNSDKGTYDTDTELLGQQQQSFCFGLYI